MVATSEAGNQRSGQVGGGIRVSGVSTGLIDVVLALAQL